MRPTIVRYGLQAGGILAAAMLLTAPFGDQIGFELGAVIGYTGMVVAFLMIWFGLRSWRDATGGGAMTFRQGLLLGLGITAVATLCYVITWEFVYRFFLPDFFERYAAATLAKAEASGATAEALAVQRADLAAFAESYRQPLIRMAYTALEPLPVGLLVSVFSAWRLRRSPAGSVGRA